MRRVDNGLFCCGVITVPGISKEVRWGVISWIRTWPASVIEAVNVVGGRDESVGGVWCARIRFVADVKGIDFLYSKYQHWLHLATEPLTTQELVQNPRPRHPTNLPRLGPAPFC